jgi:hypothetical protein
MMKRGLLEAGLTMLATPTGQGGALSGISRGLLAGVQGARGDYDKQREKALGLDKSAGLGEWRELTKNLSPDDMVKAQRIKLGLQGRASGAAVKYAEVRGADGRTRWMAFDPNDPNKVQLAGGEQVVSVSDNPPVAMSPDQINQTAQKMRADGGNPDEVARWADQQFSAYQLALGAGNSPYQQPSYKPTPLAGGMMTSRAPEEEAEAKKRAEYQAELDYAAQIEAAKAAAKAGVEAQYAPQIAAATESAKIGAENEAKLVAGAPDAMRKSLQLFTLLDKAIKHPGRQAATGTSAAVPWDFAYGSDAKDFLTIQKQLEGKAFLEAFESLKGGGQITQIEGEKATQAMARLDRAQSEGAYVEALNELKAIAASAYARAKKRTGAQPAQPSGNKFGRFVIEEN